MKFFRPKTRNILMDQVKNEDTQTESIKLSCSKWSQVDYLYITYGLFYNEVSTYDYVVLNDELERLWKKWSCPN
jgi:hypothetical protein